MDASQKAKLNAKVEAVNKAHAFANKLGTELRKFFAAYVGKKVIKADGTLLAAIDNQLMDMPNTGQLRAYKNNSMYSLSWGVYADVNGGTHCQSHSVSVYIGDLEGQTLKSVYADNPDSKFRADYTAEEIEQNRKDYKAKQDAADEAKSKLYHFGEREQ